MMTGSEKNKRVMEKKIRAVGWYFIVDVYGDHLISCIDRMQEVIDRYRTDNRLCSEEKLGPGIDFILHLNVWLRLIEDASCLGTELNTSSVKLTKSKRQQKEEKFHLLLGATKRLVKRLVEDVEDTAHIYNGDLRTDINLLLMEVIVLINVLTHEPDERKHHLLPINYEEPISDEWSIQVLTYEGMPGALVVRGIMGLIMKMQDRVLAILHKIQNKQPPIEIDEEPLVAYEKAAKRFNAFASTKRAEPVKLIDLAKEISYAVVAGKKLGVHTLRWMKELDGMISNADEVDTEELSDMSYSLYLLSCWTVYIPRLMGEYMEVDIDSPLHTEGNNKIVLS